ncbi:MAG: YdiU family protein [Chitinophagales bacterium]|nr:YdiU family protein [Chitinophagales bacterium]
MQLNINDTFNKLLPADTNTENSIRIVSNAFFSFVNPTPCSNPQIIHYATSVADLLGINQSEIKTNDFKLIFTGNKIYSNTKPYAMCYGGHQFGHWAGQLGDGRAINLFEINHQNKQWAVQLKGAGKTPYSRNADGLAVLRSSIREYLCSEVMFHLGVPTTRALSLALSGDMVLRDIMYDGNPDYEKGAIVCRVAPTFIRFGNFEILTARNEIDNLKLLADYTIEHFYPNININDDKKYIKWFEVIAISTIDLIIQWERVGFVHGVMNTDNMSILGLTIDYGPYGWLENYDENWTPNTTDAQGRRYRYGNQGMVAIWNLVQLANALFPLINDKNILQTIIDNSYQEYKIKHQNMMLQKLGLLETTPKANFFIEQLKTNLQQSAIDYTLFFRYLSSIDINDINNFITIVEECSYADDFSKHYQVWKDWLQDYAILLAQYSIENRIEQMNKINPKYVLRNYMAQLAIDAADKGDYTIIDELYSLLQNPYDEQPNMQKWFAKRPAWALNKIGCSMLSCSS